MTIDVHLESNKIQPGAILEGFVIWHSSDDDKVPKAATLSVGWHTEGRGTNDRATLKQLCLDMNHLQASFPRRIPFSVRIPDDSPVTYNGSLLRVLWQVSVVSQKPGLFKRKQRQDYPFCVVPR